jgi:hypothetical protein
VQKRIAGEENAALGVIERGMPVAVTGRLRSPKINVTAIDGNEVMNTSERAPSNRSTRRFQVHSAPSAWCSEMKICRNSIHGNSRKNHAQYLIQKTTMAGRVLAGNMPSPMSRRLRTRSL